MDLPTNKSVVKNTYHYNAMITVCEKTKKDRKALGLLEEMSEKGVAKNEVTFSSAISACEKNGNYDMALKLLKRMEDDGVPRTVIAYNAAISACEKGLKSGLAMEIFAKMKGEKGVVPTVITYSALISACEKCGQWKLALEVLEEMKQSGFGGNVIAYSACISALSRGQQWEKALEIFREIEQFGNNPSVVTYNATMTALEKGLQWERALDLFDEMKFKNLPITVVSYGSAISACEKGYQWKQCLDFLDEMTERRIVKNVIIFGAAMSCMEKSCRADIAFQLMERMKLEGVYPNVHIFNSAISACARCSMPSRGYELFQEMEKADVKRDVVTYNAVLDAVCPDVKLSRRLFEEGVRKGFYARVSRLGEQWWELDLHFLSLGGGEIALGWWFEECLVPFLVNGSKLAAVKSINIVTGYGKTRMRGARHGDDGMRKRVRGMLRYMNVQEKEQPNKGRVQIDKEAFTREVERHGGKIVFDSEGYRKFREQETTANAMPDVIQVRRPRRGAPRKEDQMGLGGGVHGGRDEQGDRNGRRREDDHSGDRFAGCGDNRRDQGFHRRDDNHDNRAGPPQRQDRYENERRNNNNERHEDHFQRHEDHFRRGRSDRSEELHMRTRPRNEDYHRRRDDVGNGNHVDARHYQQRHSRSRSRSPGRRRGGNTHQLPHDRFREPHRDRMSPGRIKEHDRRRGESRGNSGGKSPDFYRRRDNDRPICRRSRSRSRSRDRLPEFRGWRDVKRNNRFMPPQASSFDRFTSPPSVRERQNRPSSRFEYGGANSCPIELREKTRLHSDDSAPSGEVDHSVEKNQSARGYSIGAAPLCSKRGYDV